MRHIEDLTIISSSGRFIVAKRLVRVNLRILIDATLYTTSSFVGVSIAQRVEGIPIKICKEQAKSDGRVSGR